MGDSERYFIKPGYRPNLSQNSYDAADGDAYWTQERLNIGATYQYDVYAAALELIAADGKNNLLDIGCGPPQKLSRLLAGKTLNVCLVDQPSTATLAARLLPEAKFVGADLEDIDLDLGARFDAIICADVIEHLLNPDPCLAFIRRHLTIDGMLFISTPERDVLRGSECIDSPHPMHVREWNREEFRAFLESRGYMLEQHLLLPQQRLPGWKKLWGRFMSAAGMPPVWYSCQMAICRAL
jgi:SAM-dependent methyltransferase